jgi:hypothetical protein
VSIERRNGKCCSDVIDCQQRVAFPSARRQSAKAEQGAWQSIQDVSPLFVALAFFLTGK